jgi:hypothetical protein
MLELENQGTASLQNGQRSVSADQKFPQCGHLGWVRPTFRSRRSRTFRLRLATTGAPDFPIWTEDGLRRFLDIVPFAPHFAHR